MEPDPITPTSRRVEAYLDQILLPLARRLSPFHREELRRELREHLWARIEAYRELGQPEDEAVIEALHQFGGAEDFTRQWRREWMQTPPKVTLREVWEAARLALPLSLLAVFLACMPIMFLTYEVQFHTTEGLSKWLLNHDETVCSFWLCWILLLPVALGLIVGRRIKHGAFLGMFAALAADCFCGGLLNLTGESAWKQVSPSYSQPVGMVTLLAAAWLPISCTMAALGGRWTRRLNTRRLA